MAMKSLVTELKDDGIHCSHSNGDLVAIIQYVDGQAWAVRIQSDDHQSFNNQLIGLDAAEAYVWAIALHMHNSGY